jgi:hypothetical protein
MRAAGGGWHRGGDRRGDGCGEGQTEVARCASATRPSSPRHEAGTAMGRRCLITSAGRFSPLGPRGIFNLWDNFEPGEFKGRHCSFR